MANESLYDEELDLSIEDDDTASPSAASPSATSHSAASPDAQDTQADEAQYLDTSADVEATEQTEGASDTEQAPLAAEPRTLDPLDQLPIALTLRCGSLDLTLNDLRRIDAGTVLEVNGVTPGHATLCHGERIVAEGELVDVDGRLGLQITRMAARA